MSDKPATPANPRREFLARGLDRVARTLKAEGVACWRGQAQATAANGMAAPAATTEPALTLGHARGFLAPAGCTAEDWQNLVRQGLSRCVRQGQPVRAVRASTEGGEGFEVIFVPAQDEERVLGAAAFFGRAEFARLYAAHAAVVSDTVGLLLAGSGERTAGAKVEARPASVESAAALAVALLSAPGTDEAARIAADTLRGQLSAYRVSLLERRGARWRLLAVSGVNAPDRHAAATRELRERFERTLAGEAAAPGWLAADLSRWHEDSVARQVGVAVELGEGGAAPEAAEAILRASAALIAHALHVRRPFWRRAGFGPGTRAGRWLAGAAVLLVLGLLLRPVPHVFAGRCELLPAERGVAVAEARGRIVEILAEEGEAVKPGQALARLDSAEAASRLEIARQRLRRGEAEARRWQQEQDMPRLRAAKIDQDRAREEVAKLEEDIRRATLSAPVGGVVLTKDLALRRGEVVEAGEVVCEVASLERWDLQIEVDEADVGRLEQALVTRGALPVRFALQARSDLALEASVVSGREVGQMAYATERGEQVVYVTLRGIALPPELAADMRPGFTGLAKIEGAKEPFVVVAFSRLVRFIRLRVLL